jgi:beta-lactamase class C
MIAVYPRLTKFVAKRFAFALLLAVICLFQNSIAFSEEKLSDKVAEKDAAYALTSLEQRFAHDLEQKVLSPLTNTTPGAAVVVVVDGKVVLQKTWGVQTAGELEPVTTETLFRLASISKTFASAAAAILVNESTVEWQSPIKDSLAELNFKRRDYGDEISLKHIMSQSSGLMPHAYTNLVEDNMSYNRILKRLNRVDFICAPGECYGYQNVVFSLVGDVVAANTDVNYEGYVTQKIFQPLKMTRASFGRQAFMNDPNHAEPHIWTGTRWRKTRTTDHYYRIPPAAGVNASIEDMTQWLLAQLGHDPIVLSSEMLEKMHSPVIKTTLRQAHYERRRGLANTAYGLGWRLFDYGKDTGFVHHGGYVRGMRSEMVFSPALQTGMVFLTNSEPGQMSNLVFEFLDLYQDYRVANEPTASSQVSSVGR